MENSHPPRSSAPNTVVPFGPGGTRFVGGADALHYHRGNSIGEQAFLHEKLTLAPEIEALRTRATSHPGLKHLRAFADNLLLRPLTRDEIRLMFASEGAFVLQIPPGILRLASRLTDEWLTVRPFKALGRAARVLFAAVDEYGLNQIETGLLPSHHQLYLDIVAHWGITEAELVDPNNSVPEGRRFGATIAEYYRNRPIIESVGFHIANEATAPLDFGVYVRALRKFQKEYGIKGDSDPILNFFIVHDDVESSHCDMGVELAQIYTQCDPEMIAQVAKGVDAFMDGYCAYFEQINETLFGSSRS
jgi:hypothetical protein